MPKPPKSCTVPDCGRPHRSNGWCDMHRQRVNTRGTTELVVKTAAERFWEKVDRRGEDECWEWNGARDAAGYGTWASPPGHSRRAHRFAAELAGMELDGLFVLHSCDNPPCVNPSHLRPGTHRENVGDAVERRRFRAGESRPEAKLTTAEVYAIRELSANHTRTQIGLWFGIHRAHVGDLARGSKWRHLPDATPAELRAQVDAIKARAVA